MNHSRRTEEKLNRREAILNAAETVFFDKGYERSSMQEIAQQAELSRALLYVYFKDKPAIMRGIILRAGQALNARFEKVIAEADTGMQQVGNIGRAYFAFSREQPNYFDALTQVSAFVEREQPDDLTLELIHCGEQIMQKMVACLEHGLRDGSLSKERVSNPTKTAFYLRGSLHGIIMQARLHSAEDSDHPDMAEMVEYTLSMQKHALSP
ncbi:TetR/AcrR family transcriptional regulator [Halopseudomonas salegens]|uniref:Transcriptional regulator, TetR family n=1 Tax=Halopseudomonas salegens TaxID=1434072 RepID=A0A1H2FUN7_9GAMM|nr:TetR/AcrR family transcriptional regulator [Halopseudomonas salegens]SDU10728.1 transcriptional regulator, TetR family [Halopseudomonas salegens]